MELTADRLKQLCGEFAPILDGFVVQRNLDPRNTVILLAVFYEITIQTVENRVGNTGGGIRAAAKFLINKFIEDGARELAQ